MFVKPKTEMSAAEVQPAWESLLRLERRLKRNYRICRVVQPVGTVVFLFNLLLVAANFALFWGGDLAQRYFAKLPVLPALVKSLPRGSTAGIIAFSICFAYLIPLAISGAITGIFYALDRKKPQELPPLRGTEAEQAKALACLSERVYELRKRIPTWSVLAETAILTVLTALPVAYACIELAKGEERAVLEIGVGCLVLLVSLFGLYWVYALLFKGFSLLNSLFYYAPGEWALYEQYNRMDAYWVSVDPSEAARREQRAQQQEKKKRRRKAEDEE